MRNKYRPLALAALLGAGAFVVSVSGASAAAIPAVKQMNGGDDLRVDVRHRCGHNRFCGRWNGRWDGRGNRYRYRRGNHIHFYGGYYYSYPWWLVSAPIIVAGPRYYGRGSNRHVEWCLDRYRSYNPRTNTWLSYSGQVRQCISPYSY